MKLFITGAGGFVGRAVVKEARSRGHEVVAMVRSQKSAERLDGAMTVVGDLRRPGPWVDALASCDAVIHLAASTGDFYDQLASTVLGTERLLAAMRDNGVKRLVHISTFSLYDYRAIPVNGRLDETSPLELRPEDRDDYTQTKLLQEQLVREFGASSGEVVIIRPGAIYGPDKLWEAGLAVRLFGQTWAAIAPRGRQKLTYVTNCAQAIVLAAERDEAIGQTLNIVDDDLPTQRQYAAALARHGFEVPRAVPVPYRFVAVGATVIDRMNRRFFAGKARLPGFIVPAKLDARFKPFEYSNERAKRVLGWRPGKTLDEALADIAASEHD